MEEAFLVRPSMIFEIKKIIGVSNVSGYVRNFHVQWAPTWVSDHHLVGCEKLIQEFLNQQLAGCEQQRTENAHKCPSDSSCKHICKDLPLDSKEDIIDVSNAVSDTGDEVSRSVNINPEETVGSDMVMSDNCHPEDEFTSPQNKVKENENNIQPSVFIFDSENDVSSDIPIEIIKVEKNILADNDFSSNDITFDYELYLDTAGCGSSIPYTRKCDIQSVTSVESASTSPTSIDIDNANLTNDGACSISKDTDINKNEKYKNDKKKRKNNPVGKIFQSNQSKQYNYVNEKRKNKSIIFKNHRSDMPQDEPQLAHICHICGKQFHSKGNITRHIRMSHIGERRFDCSVCGKKWFQKAELLRHMRIHTGEKPFQCSLCNKRFTQHYSLKRHNCLERC